MSNFHQWANNKCFWQKKIQTLASNFLQVRNIVSLSNFYRILKTASYFFLVLSIFQNLRENQLNKDPLRLSEQVWFTQQNKAKKSLPYILVATLKSPQPLKRYKVKSKESKDNIYLKCAKIRFYLDQTFQPKWE